MNQGLPSALAAIANDAREKLKTMPFIVPMLEGTHSEPNRAYSIGLVNFAHPEIVIVGLPDHEVARQLITNAGTLVINGVYDFREPCLASDIAEGYDVAFRPVAKGSMGGGFGLGRAVLNHEFPVVQLFLPDVDGYYPWQRKVDRKFGKMQTFFKHEGPLPMTRLERKAMSS
jgi:hypothetical protein